MPFMSLLMFSLLAACVTINIYFPAAAAEKVADEIIEEIQHQDGVKQKTSPEQNSQQPVAPEDDPFSENRFDIRHSLLSHVFDLIIPAAHAKEADLNADSPEIRKLKNSMRARYGQLQAMYANGSIGILNDGFVTVRNPGNIALAMRNQVKQLVNAENNDRRALYRAIAAANGHPEWEQQIQQTFARRWIAKTQPGWWYNDGSGWKQR
ncbi:MAG: YdbL family protein [Gammaproteobacteria bacterium]|nr:YdbL family protein [Gammaproteobacteria bacterium]